MSYVDDMRKELELLVKSHRELPHRLPRLRTGAELAREKRPQLLSP